MSSERPGPLTLVLSAALAAALGALAVLWLQRGGPSVPAPATPKDPAPEPVQLQPPAGSGSFPPAPSAPMPSLESVLQQALPAVVLVETPQGRGSAFFVARNRLLTNVHVVGGASYVTLRAQGDRKLTATVRSKSPEYDLAILETAEAPPDQVFLPLGSALQTRPGQEVLAIGSPLGLLQNSVTKGIVSALRQKGPALLIQTDTPLNPGSSGGPLLDREGHVVGISTAGFTGLQGLNFAIAADHAAALLAGRSPVLPNVKLDEREASRALLSPPSTATESDRQRDRTAAAFESALAQIARQADQLDAHLNQFLAGHFQGRIQGEPKRTFYALFERDAFQGTFTRGAEGSLEGYRDAARNLRAALQHQEELARQADVYPGTRRDLRSRYGLDDRWWDQ